LTKSSVPLPNILATSMQNRAATSVSQALVTPVAQPGTVVWAVRATPTTGASEAMVGCISEFTCGRPFS